MNCLLVILRLTLLVKQNLHNHHVQGCCYSSIQNCSILFCLGVSNIQADDLNNRLHLIQPKQVRNHVLQFCYNC